MSQSKVNGFNSNMNDIAEKLSFGMSIGSISVDDSNCDIFKPVGNDPIFINLDDFQPVIHSALSNKTKTVSPEFISKMWKVDH